MAHATNFTPLVAAVLRRDAAAVVRALEGGADVNQRNEYCLTPLHYACSGSTHDADIAALLMRWGADVVVESNLQRTPLWFACSGGHHTTAMLLLASYDGAHLWRAGGGGWTPLAQCMVVPATGAAGKTAIAKALLATPGFMTPLPRVIAAVQQAAEVNAYGTTPAHPLVLHAIAQQKHWLRRRTLLLLRMLADKHRATWRCRCTDCLHRQQVCGMWWVGAS